MDKKVEKQTVVAPTVLKIFDPVEEDGWSSVDFGSFRLEGFDSVKAGIGKWIEETKGPKIIVSPWKFVRLACYEICEERKLSFKKRRVKSKINICRCCKGVLHTSLSFHGGQEYRCRKCPTVDEDCTGVIEDPMVCSARVKAIEIKD